MKSANPPKSVFVCHLLPQFSERDDGTKTPNIIYEKSKREKKHHLKQYKIIIIKKKKNFKISKYLGGIKAHFQPL